MHITDHQQLSQCCGSSLEGRELVRSERGLQSCSYSCDSSVSAFDFMVTLLSIDLMISFQLRAISKSVRCCSSLYFKNIPLQLWLSRSASICMIFRMMPGWAAPVVSDCCSSPISSLSFSISFLAFPTSSNPSVLIRCPRKILTQSSTARSRSFRMLSIRSSTPFLSPSRSRLCGFCVFITATMCYILSSISLRSCLILMILGMRLASRCISRCSPIHSAHSSSTHSRHMCRTISEGWASQLLEGRECGSRRVLVEGRKERELECGQGVVPWRLVYFLFRKFIYRKGYILQSMGGEESTSQTRFYSRYGFVQAIQDRNFGLIKVYRKRELNFDYVMIFDRLCAPGQLTEVKHQLQRIKAGFTLQQEPIFLRILTVEELQRKTCGGGGLRLYVQYLNYTLRDAILNRQQLKQPFTPDQIMYVIQGALSAYSFLRSLNANYLTVRPDAIYLNPDGLLRFSPVRADSLPPEPQQCECWTLPSEVHFQKSERQFLIQLKSTVLDLVEICPQDDYNFRKNYQLLAKINHVRTLQQLLGCLWRPQVQSLLPGKMQTTELSSVVREGLGQSFAKQQSSLRDSGRGV